jgi:hypothetical protein
MHACFWTCVGYFTGDLEVEMKKSGDFLSIPPDDAFAGRGGFRLRVLSDAHIGSLRLVAARR